MRKILFLIICSVFLIGGCGSSGGGAEFFETVVITANSEITSLDSDIMIWKLKDPNADFGDPCDDRKTFPDVIDITINSEVFPIIDSDTASPVEIENVRIDYSPGPNTPFLASRFMELGQIVEPNGEVVLEIPVMHTEQKGGFLKDLNHYTALIEERAFYTYNATLTFRVVEITTDKKGEVKTGLTIKLTDYICARDGELNCDDECYRDPNKFRP